MRGGGIGEGEVGDPDLWFGEADFGGFAELDHVVFVAGERELVIFQDDLAFGAGDFEAVGSGCLAAGGDEHSGGAIRVFEVGGDVILDLDIVVTAELAEAADPGGHPEKPADHVQVVQALIEQDTAAFTLPRGTPAAAGEVGFGAVPIGDDPVQANDFAQFA